MEMARGPKLIALLATAVVALVFLMNRNGGQSEASSMASLHLDDGYILYFQPEPQQSGPEASVETLKEYASQYATLIEQKLDGQISQRYDTLVYGLSFRLRYNKKVYSILGSDEVTQDVAQTTDDRLFHFLHSLKADDMIRQGVKMSLERDKTVSTQAEQKV